MSKDKLPGDALALSLQKVWEVIRDQKDLNLPAHKVQRSSSTSEQLGPNHAQLANAALLKHPQHKAPGCTL